MTLSRFCDIIGIAMFGTGKRIKDNPTDLLELYREVTNDDDRRAQRGKIRKTFNSQLFDTLLITLPLVFLVGKILLTFPIITWLF